MGRMGKGGTIPIIPWGLLTADICKRFPTRVD
jgi:hypothetical protein